MYKNKKVIIPEKTVFFNIKNSNWENVDQLADENFEIGINTTNFFLEAFIHEFMHVFHEDHLLKIHNVKEFMKFLLHYQSPEIVNLFKQKYAQILSKICYYATYNGCINV